MMSSSRLNTSMMIAPTSDVDFAYAPMQSYMGFHPGTVMPNDRTPVFQQHLYDGLDSSAAAAFPFQQEPSIFSGSAPCNDLQDHLLAPQITMPMAPPSMLEPMLTLPGGPAATADLYSFGGGGGFVKREDGPFADVGGRIGLNLGRRTYFSPADVLAVDRLLMRSRIGGAGAMGILGLGLGAIHHHQPPWCQAEGCKADLSAAKHYHRRHKVCEYHAKAAAVGAGGKQQRFCQQCSRFHVLAEFDEAKRSCRKRLTEHNRRRRKPAGVQGKYTPLPSKRADTNITSSYTSDYNADSATAPNKPKAISPNGNGFSCLEPDNRQVSNAPTILSLAVPPANDGDCALDTLLLQQAVQEREEEEAEQQQEQHFMLSSIVQSHQHSGSGNILSCSSMSDQHNNGSSCYNGGSANNNTSMQHFFEVDFM